MESSPLPQRPLPQRPLQLELQEVTLTVHPSAEAAFALREINLTVRDGDVLLVLGPARSGKTTLIHFIQGLLGPPASGQVRVAGQAWLSGTTAGGASRPQARLAVVTAQPRLPLGFSVADTLAFYLTRSGALTADRQAWRAGLVYALGLQPHLKNNPAELEPHLRLRLSVACALASEPALILWDDVPTHECDLLARMMRLRRTRCAVLATSREEQLVRCATQVFVLRALGD